jgi:hypothetical protein
MHGYGFERYADGGVFVGPSPLPPALSPRTPPSPAHAPLLALRADARVDWSAGQFKDSERHGLGQYSMAGGRSYSGQWRKGQQHGVGVEVQVRRVCCPAALWAGERAAGCGAP